MEVDLDDFGATRNIIHLPTLTHLHLDVHWLDVTLAILSYLILPRLELLHICISYGSDYVLNARTTTEAFPLLHTLQIASANGRFNMDKGDELALLKLLQRCPNVATLDINRAGWIPPWARRNSFWCPNLTVLRVPHFRGLTSDIIEFLEDRNKNNWVESIKTVYIEDNHRKAYLISQFPSISFL